MRTAGVILSACAVVAALCSCQRADVQQELDRKTARVDELEQTVVDMEQKHARELENKFSDLTQEYNRHIDILRKDFEDRLGQSELTIGTLQQRVAEKDAEITKLKGAITRAEATARDWEERYRAEQQKKAVVSVAPSAALADTGEPAKPKEDLFPLEVFDVSGRKVVIARRMVTEYVDTEETYRDEFGQTRKVRKPRQVPREDFGYQVSFSVRNKSDHQQDVSVRAGALTRVIAMNPGVAVTNQLVTSALGAPLTVMVGGFTKSFDVAYEESAQ